MSLPNPEQGARGVLQRAVTVLRDGLDAAIEAINVRLEDEGAGYTIASPSSLEIKQHEVPAVWPSSYPAVRLQRTASTALPLLGGLGLRDETVQFVARCYVQREHGRSSVTDDFNLADLSSEAWDFAAAVRQVLERDLPGASGIWNVTVTQQREQGPAQVAGDNLRYIYMIELTLTVLQRVRENFGTTT